MSRESGSRDRPLATGRRTHLKHRLAELRDGPPLLASVFHHLARHLQSPGHHTILRHTHMRAHTHMRVSHSVRTGHRAVVCLLPYLAVELEHGAEEDRLRCDVWQRK